jgi:hypothetical protein
MKPLVLLMDTKSKNNSKYIVYCVRRREDLVLLILLRHTDNRKFSEAGLNMPFVRSSMCFVLTEVGDKI